VNARQARVARTVRVLSQRDALSCFIRWCVLLLAFSYAGVCCYCLFRTARRCARTCRVSVARRHRAHLCRVRMQQTSAARLRASCAPPLSHQGARRVTCCAAEWRVGSSPARAAPSPGQTVGISRPEKKEKANNGMAERAASEKLRYWSLTPGHDLFHKG
jgi:hypothetical protein